MKLVITIESDNEGVGDDHAVAKLVHTVANKIAAGGEGGRIKDANGNTVGSWEYERAEEEEEEEEDSEEDYDPGFQICPVCSSDQIESQGTLGVRPYFRCKHCGTYFSPNPNRD